MEQLLKKQMQMRVFQGGESQKQFQHVSSMPVCNEITFVSLDIAFHSFSTIFWPYMDCPIAWIFVTYFEHVG